MSGSIFDPSFIIQHSALSVRTGGPIFRSAFSAQRSPIVRKAARGLLPLTAAALAAAGLVAVMLVFHHGPAQGRLARASAAYDAARQEVGHLKSARRTETDLAALWETLPVRTDFASLILAVSELARQNRVAIPGITYSFQTVEDGRAVKASMVFQAAGDYAAIRGFIHRLETAGSYMAIESLEASRARDAGQVALQVRVVTFLKPDPPAGRAGI